VCPQVQLVAYVIKHCVHVGQLDVERLKCNFREINIELHVTKTEIATCNFFTCGKRPAAHWRQTFPQMSWIKLRGEPPVNSIGNDLFCRWNTKFDRGVPRQWKQNSQRAADSLASGGGYLPLEKQQSGKPDNQSASSVSPLTSVSVGYKLESVTDTCPFLDINNAFDG